jgi:hypothetical protein
MTDLHPPLAAAPFEPSLLLTVVAPSVAATALLGGWLIRRRQAHTRGGRPGSPAVKVAALAAIGCTSYSADTSWRFAADYLAMRSVTERATMFAAAELALFATALMARQNLNNQGAPGLPGVLAWVITAVQVIPAYAESGPVGGTVRAFVGPVMAAMLWHQAMGIELRLHKPEAASHGVLATLGRQLRERLLSRLGIAERDRDAAQITRDRATTRAVTLAARLAGRSPKQRANRRGRRIARRLESALVRASVGTDLNQRRALLEQLAARRHATALATVDLPSPWTAFARGEEAEGEVPASRHPAGAGRMTSETRPDGNPAGPSTGTEPTAPGDRGPAWDGPQDNGPTPAPGTGESTNGDRAQTGPGDREAPAPGTGQTAGDTGGTGPHTHKPTAQSATRSVPAGGDQHAETASGTRRHDGDRPTSDNNGDQRPADADAGTAHIGDRPRTIPAKRKPQPKRPHGRSRNGSAKQARKQSPLTVEQMVEQVRPHVPALLTRDGNAAITRVQLREILGAQGLQCRNERLTPLLQRLRDETSTTTTTRTKTP